MKDAASLWGSVRESVSVASETHKDKQIILLKKTISTQEEYINGLLRSAKKSLDDLNSRQDESRHLESELRRVERHNSSIMQQYSELQRQHRELREAASRGLEQLREVELERERLTLRVAHAETQATVVKVTHGVARTGDSLPAGQLEVVRKEQEIHAQAAEARAEAAERRCQRAEQSRESLACLFAAREARNGKAISLWSTFWALKQYAHTACNGSSIAAGWGAGARARMRASSLAHAWEVWAGARAEDMQRLVAPYGEAVMSVAWGAWRDYTHAGRRCGMIERVIERIGGSRDGVDMRSVFNQWAQMATLPEVKDRNVTMAAWGWLDGHMLKHDVMRYWSVTVARRTRGRLVVARRLKARERMCKLACVVAWQDVAIEAREDTKGCARAGSQVHGLKARPSSSPVTGGQSPSQYGASAHAVTRDARGTPPVQSNVHRIVTWTAATESAGITAASPLWSARSCDAITPTESGRVQIRDLGSIKVGDLDGQSSRGREFGGLDEVSRRTDELAAHIAELTGGLLRTQKKRSELSRRLLMSQHSGR